MIVLGVEFLLVLQFVCNREGVNFIFLQTDQIQVSVRHGSVAINYFFSTAGTLVLVVYIQPIFATRVLPCAHCPKYRGFYLLYINISLLVDEI